MSSQSGRHKLLQRLDYAGQTIGNRNVLLVQAIASQIGMSATEFECLSLLDDLGPVPAGRLAEETGLTTGAITGIIDRMERAGFARREPDTTDRRRVIIHAVTPPEAVTKIRALYAPLQQAFHDITAKYTNEELAVIADYMEHWLKATHDAAGQVRRSTDDAGPAGLGVNK
jgi:DNA-binding MarR family transcriptional regulator